MWRMQRVPMKTPRSRFRSTEYHIVEASLRALDRMPGLHGLWLVVHQPGVGQLIAGGDAAILSVDAEHPHGCEGSWAGALQRFDEGLRGKGHAEKTRRAYGVDLGQLAEWAAAHGIEPLELDRALAAPLRRRAVRARRGQVHRGPQAGGHPHLLRPDGRARRARRQPGRPRRRAPRRTPTCRACSSPARSPSCSSACPAPARSSCATGRCSSLPTPRACAPRSS